MKKQTDITQLEAQIQAQLLDNVYGCIVIDAEVEPSVQDSQCAAIVDDSIIESDAQEQLCATTIDDTSPKAVIDPYYVRNYVGRGIEAQPPPGH